MNNCKKLNQRALAVFMLISLILVGCSDLSGGHISAQPTCEVSVDAVCAPAIYSYFTSGEVRTTWSKLSRSSQLVSLVAPVTMPSGELAAEADCYVAVEAGGPWLVYAHLAISPRSRAAMEHLRNEGLCADRAPERRLALGSSVDHFGLH